MQLAIPSQLNLGICGANSRDEADGWNILNSGCVLRDSGGKSKARFVFNSNRVLHCSFLCSNSECHLFSFASDRGIAVQMESHMATVFHHASAEDFQSTQLSCFLSCASSEIAIEVFFCVRGAPRHSQEQCVKILHTLVTCQTTMRQ